MDLTQQKCEPCEGGTKPFDADEIKTYQTYLKTPWDVSDPPSPEASEGQAKKISRKFKFKNFVEAIDFVNKIAEIAESEGHHPDIKISYNRVRIDLWTHAIGGLSINDFILASKINFIK